MKRSVLTIITLMLIAAMVLPANVATPTAAKGTKFYWIQPLKGHPVHQLTQIAFKEGCKELGMECEVVGPDAADTQQAIAAAEQVLAKGDAAGVSIWTGTDAFLDVIKKYDAAGIPVVAPHFAVPEGTWPKNTVIIGADPNEYPKEAAQKMCKAIGDNKGSVAITQGSFNTTENAVAAAFTAEMAKVCPNVKVLKPEEEGFDAPKAIAKAVAIMQANPDLIGGFSTTGGGPTTWAGAQKEAGKQVLAIGMDYTRVNLDLVKSGEVFAVVGQPLYDESKGAAQLLKKMASGEKVDYWTKLTAPTITKDDLPKWYELLDKVEAQIVKAPAAPKGKFYWIQPLKGHPVHQLTQIAFKEGCKELGMECEVVGPDAADTQQAIAAAEQVLAKGDAAGVSIWTGTDAFLDVIKKFEAAKIPVVAPHFAVPEGTWPKNTVIIGADPNEYPKEAAQKMCKAIGDNKGSVAITQGSFNTTENAVAAAFTAEMAKVCPNVKVLKPEEEGFDAPKAIAKAVAIMQANPDLIGGFSTTGGGPTTWAGAQKETGKKVLAIGMDYTRVNLDLVKSGEVFAVVGQPLYDESKGAAQLLLKMASGEKVEYWTKLNAPTITKDDLPKWYELLDKVEAQITK